MKDTIRYLFCCGFSILSVVAVSQEASDYISTDTTLTSGLSLVKGLSKDNALYVDRKMGDTRKRYFPSDIIEYGFKDGTIYKSFSVSINGVDELRFLQQLHGGKTSLYMFSGDGANRFFVSDSNKQLKEFFKEDLSGFLSAFIGDCEEAERNLRYVKFNKYSLGRFFKDLESCRQGPFPAIRFSVFTGVQMAWLSPASNSEVFMSLGSEVNSGLNLGVNALLAIRSTNFSLVPELSLQSTRGKNVFRVSTAQYDLLMNEWRLDMPIMLRYTFFGQKFNPFLELGPMTSLSVDNNALLFSYREFGDGIFIELQETGVTSKVQAGFCLNAGFTIKSSKRHAYFGRIGYRTLSSGSPDFEAVNTSQLRISIGLSY